MKLTLPSKRISFEKAENVCHKTVSFLVYHLVGSHFGIFKDLCYRYEASGTTKTYSFSRLKPYEKKSTHVISVVILGWNSVSTLTLQYVKASSKFMDHKTVCVGKCSIFMQQEFLGEGKVNWIKLESMGESMRRHGCVLRPCFLWSCEFLCLLLHYILTTKRIDHKIPHIAFTGHFTNFPGRRCVQRFTE